MNARVRFQPTPGAATLSLQWRTEDMPTVGTVLEEGDTVNYYLPSVGAVPFTVPAGKTVEFVASPTGERLVRCPEALAQVLQVTDASGNGVVLQGIAPGEIAAIRLAAGSPVASDSVVISGSDSVYFKTGFGTTTFTGEGFGRLADADATAFDLDLDLSALTGDVAQIVLGGSMVRNPETSIPMLGVGIGGITARIEPDGAVVFAVLTSDPASIILADTLTAASLPALIADAPAASEAPVIDGTAANALLADLRRAVPVSEDFAVVVSGGVSPVSVSLGVETAGLSATAGVLSGIPTESGAIAVAVNAVDARGVMATAVTATGTIAQTERLTPYPVTAASWATDGGGTYAVTPLPAEGIFTPVSVGSTALTGGIETRGTVTTPEPIAAGEVLYAKCRVRQGTSTATRFYIRRNVGGAWQDKAATWNWSTEAWTVAPTSDADILFDSYSMEQIPDTSDWLFECTFRTADAGVPAAAQAVSLRVTAASTVNTNTVIVLGGQITRGTINPGWIGGTAADSYVEADPIDETEIEPPAIPFADAVMAEYADLDANSRWFYVDPVSGATTGLPSTGYTSLALAQASPFKYFADVASRMEYGDVCVFKAGVHIPKVSTDPVIKLGPSDGLTGSAYQSGTPKPKWLIGEGADTTLILGTSGILQSAVVINHHHVVIANMAIMGRASGSDYASVKLQGDASGEFTPPDGDAGSYITCHDVVFAGVALPKTITVSSTEYTTTYPYAVRGSNTARVRVLGCTLGSPDHPYKFGNITGARFCEWHYNNMWYTDSVGQAYYCIRVKSNSVGFAATHNRFVANSNTVALRLGETGFSVAEADLVGSDATDLDDWEFDTAGKAWRYWGYGDSEHPSNLTAGAGDKFQYAETCGKIVGGVYEPAKIEWNAFETPSSSNDVIRFQGSVGIDVRNNGIGGRTVSDMFWKGITRDAHFVAPEWDAVTGRALDTGDWRVQTPVSIQNRVAVVGLAPDALDPLQANMSLGPYAASYTLNGNPNRWCRWPYPFTPGVTAYTEGTAVCHPAMAQMWFSGSEDVHFADNFVVPSSGSLWRTGIYGGQSNITVAGVTVGRIAAPPAGLDLITNFTEGSNTYDSTMEAFYAAATAAGEVIGTDGWDDDAVLRKLGMPQ